ncbi:MAG TPA: hypothetical protein G4O10_00660 [Dehalococcoidia bacterium]|nr:hypothetical protein [Dehalococcoidia bacterium]
MSNLIWALLPIILLAIIYIFIFTRKGEFERAKNNLKRQDWITFFAVIFAGVTLSSSMRASGLQFPDPPWLLIPLVLFIAVPVIIVLICRVRTGRPIILPSGDERTQLIFAKSARNTMFATYLALFLHLTITELDTLDANWLSIVIGSGLFVLLASLFFYYYRAS